MKLPTKRHLFYLLAMTLIASPRFSEAAKERVQGQQSYPVHKGRSNHLAQFVIESIVIEGNERTRQSLIHKLLSIEPGESVNEDRIDQGRLRLMSMGLFQSVRIRLERGETEGHVLLIVSVVERGTILLSDLFLGYSDQTPFYGGFGLTDTNVAGTAFIAHGAFVVGGENRQAFRVYLREPGFWLNRHTLGVSVLHLRGTEASSINDSSRNYLDFQEILLYRRTGGRASISLSSLFDSSIGMHYRLEDISSRTQITSTGPESPYIHFLDAANIHILEGRSYISTISFSFDHDTRNDPFMARRGFHLEAHAEIGSRIFGSSYEYSRYISQMTLHYPTAQNHSIRLAFGGGLVQGDAPFFDRFNAADHSYFTTGSSSLPRALDVSFTSPAQYDRAILSGDLSYRIALPFRNSFVYRSFLHASAALTLSNETADVSILEMVLKPRNEISRTPLSGDIGVSLDTSIGIFSLGFSYPLDLLL